MSKMVYLQSRTATRMETQLAQSGLGSVYTRVRGENFDCPSNPTDEMATKVYYNVRVPWFLTNEKRINNQIRSDLLDVPDDPAHIEEIPMSSSGNTVGLIIMVPCSVTTTGEDVDRLIEFGHGIFADRSREVK